MRYLFSPIAHIRSDYPEKFGVPRQAGLVIGAPARIVFEKEYRRPEAFRELAGFSHIWLLWVFSQSPVFSGGKGLDPEEAPDTLQPDDIIEPSDWSPTVRPPRLGGNRRVGVFASRSPNRPNPIGLSAVRLLGIESDGDEGPVLIVDGADLVDGTPILDIKPYIAYADSLPDASGGFAANRDDFLLEVFIPQEEEIKVPPGRREALRSLLSQRPVPGYRSDSEQVYGLSFAGVNVRFTIDGRRLTVQTINPVGTGSR